MNETTGLERGYRRVLACYPKAFRQENEQEVLTVLLATAADGQRRVGLAEAADLIRGALRMRLRSASRPPRTVRGAVRLMCAGAVVELAAGVTILVTMASVKTALTKVPGITAAQWHQALALLTVKAAGAMLAVGLWLLMAWYIRRGRDAARFAFLCFFALITLTMIIALAQQGVVYAPADMIAGAAIWLIALVTMVLIFARPSNAYYRQGARPPVIHSAG